MTDPGRVFLQMEIQGTTGSADLVMEFSHYGAPVTITAPASSDTTSFTSFVQNLGHSGAS